MVSLNQIDQRVSRPKRRQVLEDRHRLSIASQILESDVKYRYELTGDISPKIKYRNILKNYTEIDNKAFLVEKKSNSEINNPCV